MVFALSFAARADAQQACTPESVGTVPWSWATKADQTSGAADYKLSKSQLGAIVAQMNRYGELLEKAVMPQPGFMGTSYKVVGLSPVFEDGPMAQEVHGSIAQIVCENGKAKAGAIEEGYPGIEVNWLWSVTSNTQTILGGKPVYTLNYPLGDIRGYPLTEVPYGAAYGGDLHLLRWAALVTYPGKLPFRYVSRREYLDYAKGYVEEQKRTTAAMLRKSLPVRPAAEQEAEKARDLEKIERNETGHLRETLRARYLAEYRTDEQKLDDAVRKSNTARDAQIARLAVVENAYSPAQLAEPAILPPGKLNPNGIDANWGFTNDLKTDRTHVCTFECNHGQQLVTVNEEYFDKTLPRTTPQFFVVEFHWDAGVKERYRNPVAERFRDEFFARFDFDALAAMLPRAEGAGKPGPGPSLPGLSSGDPAPPSRGAAERPEAARPAPSAPTLPQPSLPSAAPSGTPASAPSGVASAAEEHLKEYEEVVAKGNALYAAGDYFEAVRVYERAARVAYNNKLTVDRAALDKLLARARAARDAKKKH